MKKRNKKLLKGAWLQKYRLPLNPGGLSVDEKGNKRLTQEISGLGTIFVGMRSKKN